MIEPRWIVYDPAPDQEEDPPIIGAEHAKWGILYRARAYAQTAIEMRADELTEGAVIIRIDASIPVLAEIVEEAIQQEYLHDERAPAIMEVLGTVLVSYLTREVGTLIQQAEHWAPTHPLATHHRINKADAYQQIIYKMENGGFSAMFEEAQRPAVHERPAARGQQYRAGLHQREALRVDEMLGGRRERAMQAHDVGAAEEIVELGEFDLEIGERRGVRRILVERQDRHAHRRTDARQRPADSADPDDAEHFAGELGDRGQREAPVDVVCPFARADGGRVQRRLAHQLQ